MPISHIQDGDSGLTARNILNQTIDVVNATTSSDAFPYTGSAEISGSLQVTGYISATEPIIGSLDGTASYADSSSFSLTASYVTSSNVLGPFGFDSVLSSSYSLTASYLEGYISPFPFTGSAIISGSLIVTGSIESSEGITGSLYGTASWAENSISSSYTISSSYSLQSISSSFANSSISSSYATTASYVTTAVPYSGATNDVDLGNYSLNAKNIHIKGTLGNGHLGLKFQSTTPTATANESSLFADSNGDIAWQNSNLYSTTLKTSANTANRIYTFPNRTGILADDTDLAGKQNSATILTTFSALANSAGWLYNNGSGILSYSTPTKTDIGLGNVTNSLQLVAANNLSDVVSASTSRINLGATTVGSNLFTATNSSVAVSWIRINADNTVTFLNANNTLNAILPSQGAGTINKFLQSDGTNTSWVSGNSGTVTSVAMTVPSFLSVSGSPITSSGTLAVTLSGTALPVANGGTGATSASITAFNNITGLSAAGTTGTTSTNLVFSTSPTLVTPILGTPTSGTLTNCTGLPEAGLSLTDITTANTSTSAHGFFPKLTSNTVYYVSNAGALTALALGASGTVLTSNGATSAPTFTTPTSGAAISGLTLATASNTIDNTNYAQEWQWSTLGAGNGLKLSSTSTAAASNTQTLLNIALSGANGTSTQTTYGLQVANTHTGTSSTNVAGYFSASGGTSDNFAILTNGKIRIGGTTGPSSTTQILEVEGGIYGIYAFGQYRWQVTYNSGTDTISVNSGNVNEYRLYNQGPNLLTLGTGNTTRITLDGNAYTTYFGNGQTASSPSAATLMATSGSGTNITGASLTKAGGKGTGTGAGGDVKTQTSVKGSSGTTLQTLGDRQSVVGKYTDLTESSATAFVRVNVPSGTVAGGTIIYTIQADDATNYQSLTGRIIWDAVNKGGTTTIVITDTQNGTGACSSGTLTNTTTAVDSGSGNVDFKLNAVSSLTQTTLRVNCQVFKNYGTGSITAQ